MPDAAGLTEGEYSGQVTIDAPGAVGSPQVVTIHLLVARLRALTRRRIPGRRRGERVPDGSASNSGTVRQLGGLGAV